MDAGEGLRISDEQRERAVQEIREHYAVGRLDDDELDARVQRAYAARTEADLSSIRADLPQLPASPVQQRAELVERRRVLQRRLLQQSGGGLALFAVGAVIWALAGAHGQFWPVWIALVTVLPLLRNAWRLYGPAPELDRVERELGRRERSDRGRSRERQERRRSRRRLDR